MAKNEYSSPQFSRVLSRISRFFHQTTVVLSLIVVLAVCWCLKLTGITMAGEAFCGQDEHTHTEECTRLNLICQLEETPGHFHNDSCLAQELICGPEESETHIHEDTCWDLGPGFGCSPSDEENHVHTDECVTEDTQLTCGLTTDPGHTHSAQCYEAEQLCQLEEHIHSADCYSNDSADLETADDWETSLSDLVRSAIPSENVAAVARSQLGCQESLLNFKIDDQGVRRGITRYGQWYGNAYGSWSAMFVSFCLEYAGLGDLPLSAGSETLRLGWQDAGLYVPAPDYVPAQGNLLFLDKDGNGSADAVAVITGSDDTAVYAIEGDIPVPENPEESSNEELIPDQVAETVYALTDPAILGFGLIPTGNGDAVLAVGERCTVWFDGTLGGLMSMGGAANQSVSTREGNTITLPESWASPEKYSYALKGWYDVTNSKYYAPGEEVTVTGNMVFYPDWVAASYDVGQFNSRVANTVSTSDFVTVQMFDYNFLFNVLSSRADVSFTQSGHTETWRLLTSGNNPYNGQQTLDFIFRDWDRGNEDISYPSGIRNPGPHYPTNSGEVYPGLYNSRLGDVLFNPATEALGKEYLGTGDHLFQLCTDPSHEHYGYYYYDSAKNAASYNRSQQRFYVYDYLECTSDSVKDGGSGQYADFLPFNSPYANTNGKTVQTYGGSNYRYDAKYANDNYNSTNNVGTNYAFGMRMDVEFYIPNVPGEVNEDGSYGNRDIHGDQMHFLFSGDDDVWVLIDGKLVLDLGGIHGQESGDINFSSGQVTVNGVVNNELTNTLRSIGAGEHTLTLLYLERGSSRSNCSIYFNLAPRFSFNIQKEDVLTRHVLNGATFSVYTDEACTIPAELWVSKASHDRGDAPTNEFTVVDGSARMWGMGSGNRYYIKETKGPDDPNYTGLPNGIIELTFDDSGSASYNVRVIDGGSGISGGFTVHGFRIDVEVQEAYIIATNAPNWVDEVTSVQVRKLWDDAVDHTWDTITVYLTVTAQDGTVRRLQEAQLGSGNNWHHTWENLPKFWEDGTPIHYDVEEAYIPGYYDRIETLTSYSTWVPAGNFQNGQTYLIRSSLGYLSTQNGNSDTGFKWVDQATAENSSLAQWTATVNNSGLKLTNRSGQILTFYYGRGNPTDFYASTGGESNNAKQYYKTVSADGGLRLYYDAPNNRDYYLISDMTSAQKFRFSTTARNGLILTPMYKDEVTVTAGVGYRITNTPLSQETSLTVKKQWDYGRLEPGTLHEQMEVTVKLLANGKDTGRTVTLSLRNGWQDAFRGLPYTDSSGNVITYTIEEVWSHPDWIPTPGEIHVSGSTNPPSYSTTLVNRYRPGLGGPELPSTGSYARLLYILCGGGMMLASLVYGIVLQHKQERRTKQVF